MIEIPALLSAEEVEVAVATLLDQPWVDGKVTAGKRSARAKNNRQLAEDAPVAIRLGEQILSRLSDNALFMSVLARFDPADFKSKERKKIKWIIISGDKDQNYAEILKRSPAWTDARLDYRFIDIPGMAHTNAAAADLKTALDWIGL